MMNGETSRSRRPITWPRDAYAVEAVYRAAHLHIVAAILATLDSKCRGGAAWAEGGSAMGTDPAGAIRDFGARKQIYEIHFRNVSSPLPRFQETHVDNGYYDMYKAMKALVDIKYDGIVYLDHAVPMVGGDRTYQAFAMGYMQALRHRALAARS